MGALTNNYTQPARYTSAEFQTDLLFITETHLEIMQGKDANLTWKKPEAHTPPLLLASCFCKTSLYKNYIKQQQQKGAEENFVA